MLGRTAAGRVDKLVTPPQAVTIATATRKADPVEQLQSAQSVRAERQVQAQDKSQLNYAYQKATNTLSVKVINKQTGAFIREIEFKGFDAMTFNSHGYKGNYVDRSA